MALLIFLSARSPAQTAALTVAAAADLAQVEPALLAACCKNELPPVRFVNGASGTLKQQIEHGAPYDVFLSANADYIAQLGSSGKIRPGSVRVYALGRLALLWRDGKKHPFSELAGAQVRFITIPNPQLAPYGKAAEEALRHEGLWDKLKSKLVYGENVSQALQLFDSGNADAVLTSAALVRNRHPTLIAESWYVPIRQTAGIVADTANQKLAYKFLDFLTSEAGQAIFARYGYGRPQAH